MYPKAWAALMAGTILGCIGILLRTSTTSSMVFPCAWSSFIILSCNIFLPKQENQFSFLTQKKSSKQSHIHAHQNQHFFRKEIWTRILKKIRKSTDYKALDQKSKTLIYVSTMTHKSNINKNWEFNHYS